MLLIGFLNLNPYHRKFGNFVSNIACWLFNLRPSSQSVSDKKEELNVRYIVAWEDTCFAVCLWLLSHLIHLNLVDIILIVQYQTFGQLYTCQNENFFLSTLQLWSQNIQDLGICEELVRLDDFNIPDVDLTFQNFDELFGGDQDPIRILFDDQDVSCSSLEKDKSVGKSDIDNLSAMEVWISSL